MKSVHLQHHETFQIALHSDYLFIVSPAVFKNSCYSIFLPTFAVIKIKNSSSGTVWYFIAVLSLYFLDYNDTDCLLDVYYCLFRFSLWTTC